MLRATARRARAFSLIELIMVMITIGMIAAIAIPRLSSAGAAASENSLVASSVVFQKSIDHYIAEHAERSPAAAADGSLDKDGGMFAKRILHLTDEWGESGSGAVFGPYLRSIPRNPYNGRQDVRVDGPGAGENTAGWRFDSVSCRIEPDDGEGVNILIARMAHKHGSEVQGKVKPTSGDVGVTAAVGAEKD